MKELRDADLFDYHKPAAVTERDVLRNLYAQLAEHAPEDRERVLRIKVGERPRLFAGDVWECLVRVLARVERGEDMLGAIMAEGGPS